jgi:preprotein translocase subunit SecG
MVSALTGLHVVVCVMLIMIVLLQTGKGADMGAAFGGGSSQTLFGSAGPVSFLNKLTTMVAVVFMLTSLTLAFMSTQSGVKTVVDEVPAQEAPMVPGSGGEAQ